MQHSADIARTQWMTRMRAVRTPQVSELSPFLVEEHLGARREKMNEVFIDGTYLSR